MRLTVLSYNIHKGFSTTGLGFTLRHMKKNLDQTKANLVCLQEVLGRHEELSKNIDNWPIQSQFEFLADQVWDHYSYGQNAIYASGHHGNAVLSEYPIVEWKNTDISTNRFESRGFLWCRVQIPQMQEALHVVTVHLDLLEVGRMKQVSQLADALQRFIPPAAPLIIAGDFNDWTGRACRYLEHHLKMSEAHSVLTGSYAKTFPSAFPILKLDRVLVRNAQVVSARVLSENGWRSLSDHLPLLVELELKNE